MKKIYYTFLILVSITCGCGKKDAHLLNLVPGAPLVNPETKILLKDNALLHLQLDPGNIIRGLNRTHIFRTNDQFESFSIWPYSFTENHHIKMQGKNILLSKSSLYEGINVSVDSGFTWRNIKPELEGMYTGGYIPVIDMHLIDNENLLLVTGTSEDHFLNGLVFTTLIYKVDLRTQKGIILSKIDGYYPEAIKLINENVGWIQLKKAIKINDYYDVYVSNNVLVAKTTDGGQSWSSPVMVDDSAYLKMSAGRDGHLFLYGFELGYFSSDGGVTWQMTNGKFRFTDVFIVNAGNIFATLENGLIKSSDGGKTWNYPSDWDQTRYMSGKVYFLNEKDGINYNQERLYLTTDGGITWKTLLYPYSYIIN